MKYVVEKNNKIVFDRSGVTKQMTHLKLTVVIDHYATVERYSKFCKANRVSPRRLKLMIAGYKGVTNRELETIKAYLGITTDDQIVTKFNEIIQLREKLTDRG